MTSTAIGRVTSARSMAANHMVVHRAATDSDEHYYSVPTVHWSALRKRKIIRAWLKRERKLEQPGELAFIDTPKGWKSL